MFLLSAPAVLAGEARPVVEDPVLEKRVMSLAEELRCLVCQNQSLADSNAGLAVDLRNQVREKMKQGKKQRGDRRVHGRARYGDFVLYRPPVKATTLLLWFGPLLLLLCGLGALFYGLARRQTDKTAELSESDRARAASLLAPGEMQRTAMTVFLVLGALLIAGALCFILPALVSRRHETTIAADSVNAAVYRDQLQELDANVGSRGPLAGGLRHRAPGARSAAAKRCPGGATRPRRAPVKRRRVGAIAAALAVPVLASCALPARWNATGDLS